MPLMLLPILYITLSQFPILNHEQVLRIIFLGSLGEIEGPGNHGLPVNDHDLVVGANVMYTTRNKVSMRIGRETLIAWER